MTFLDGIAILWLLGGTLALKRLLRVTRQKRVPRPVFVLVAAAAATAPALAMKLQVAPYSAAGVITAAITLFWFAILGARVNNAA